MKVGGHSLHFCILNFTLLATGSHHDRQHHFARERGVVCMLRVGCEVKLTANFGALGDAADGPLEPGVPSVCI